MTPCGARHPNAGVVCGEPVDKHGAEHRAATLYAVYEWPVEVAAAVAAPVNKCPCGAYGDEPHQARAENFEPNIGQVTAKLEREARSVAEALGHTWSGLAAVGGGSYGARCFRCEATCRVEPRAFLKAPVRGEMVTFKCTAAPIVDDGPKCRHCGRPMPSGYQNSNRYCTNPNRMGPCE